MASALAQDLSQSCRAVPSLFRPPTPMAMLRGAVFAVLALAAAVELTPDTWDAETAGKTIFVKFLAPW